MFVDVIVELLLEVKVVQTQHLLEKLKIFFANQRHWCKRADNTGATTLVHMVYERLCFASRHPENFVEEIAYSASLGSPEDHDVPGGLQKLFCKHPVPYRVVHAYDGQVLVPPDTNEFVLRLQRLLGAKTILCVVQYNYRVAHIRQ